MLGMIAGNWTVSRTNAALQNTRPGLTVSNVSQLVLDGFVYAVGTDWVVRVGLVRHGQTPKGLVIEVRSLPRSCDALRGALYTALGRISPPEGGSRLIIQCANNIRVPFLRSPKE